MDQADANIGSILGKLDGWLDGFFRLLPNIVVALIVAVLFWLLGLGIGKLVNRTADKRGRASLGEVGGSLARWATAPDNAKAGPPGGATYPNPAGPSLPRRIDPF